MTENKELKLSYTTGLDALGELEVREKEGLFDENTRLTLTLKAAGYGKDIVHIPGIKGVSGRPLGELDEVDQRRYGRDPSKLGDKIETIWDAGEGYPPIRYTMPVPSNKIVNTTEDKDFKSDIVKLSEAILGRSLKDGEKIVPAKVFTPGVQISTKFKKDGKFHTLDINTVQHVGEAGNVTEETVAASLTPSQEALKEKIEKGGAYARSELITGKDEEGNPVDAAKVLKDLRVLIEQGYVTEKDGVIQKA